MERNALSAQHAMCLLFVRILSSSDLDQREYDRCIYEMENSSSCAEMLGQQQSDAILAQLKLLFHYRDTEFIDRRFLSDALAALTELRCKISLLVSLYWK